MKVNSFSISDTGLRRRINIHSPEVITDPKFRKTFLDSLYFTETLEIDCGRNGDPTNDVIPWLMGQFHAYVRATEQNVRAVPPYIKRVYENLFRPFSSHVFLAFGEAIGREGYEILGAETVVKIKSGDVFINGSFTSDLAALLAKRKKISINCGAIEPNGNGGLVLQKLKSDEYKKKLFDQDHLQFNFGQVYIIQCRDTDNVLRKHVFIDIYPLPVKRSDESQEAANQNSITVMPADSGLDLESLEPGAYNRESVVYVEGRLDLTRIEEIYSNLIEGNTVEIKASDDDGDYQSVGIVIEKDSWNNLNIYQKADSFPPFSHEEIAERVLFPLIYISLDRKVNFVNLGFRDVGGLYDEVSISKDGSIYDINFYNSFDSFFKDDIYKETLRSLINAFIKDYRTINIKCASPSESLEPVKVYLDSLDFKDRFKVLDCNGQNIGPEFLKIVVP
jgi:hypothetical protein